MSWAYIAIASRVAQTLVVALGVHWLEDVGVISGTRNEFELSNALASARHYKCFDESRQQAVLADECGENSLRALQERVGKAPTC